MRERNSILIKWNSNGSISKLILYSLAVLMIVVLTTTVINKIRNNDVSKLLVKQSHQIETLTKQLSNWKQEFKTSSCRISDAKPNKRGHLPVNFTIFRPNGPTRKPIWKGIVYLEDNVVSLEYKLIQFQSPLVDKGKVCLYKITKVSGVKVPDRPDERYEHILSSCNKKVRQALLDILENTEKYVDNEELIKLGIRCKSVVSVSYAMRTNCVYINSIASNGAMYHDELYL